MPRARAGGYEPLLRQDAHDILVKRSRRLSGIGRRAGGSWG